MNKLTLIMRGKEIRCLQDRYPLCCLCGFGSCPGPSGGVAPLELPADPEVEEHRKNSYLSIKYSCVYSMVPEFNQNLRPV